jgi:hypothetical protein
MPRETSANLCTQSKLKRICLTKKLRYQRNTVLDNQHILSLPQSNVTGAIFPRDGFCGDLTPSGYETLVICHHSVTSQERVISTTMGALLAIGSFALLLTVVISCALPDTRRRLHGRLSLMHNVTLLVAYVSTGALRIIAVWYNMSVALSKVVSK